MAHDVLQFREKYRTTEISESYNGWLHLSFTSLGALSVVLYSAMQVEAVRHWEWLTVPLTFFFANLVEYLGHRGPMHKPQRLLRVRRLRRIYVRHYG